jgi:hypothetical protein
MGHTRSKLENFNVNQPVFKTSLGIHTILKISFTTKKRNGLENPLSKVGITYMCVCVCIEKKNLMIMLASCFTIVEAHGWGIFPK